MDRPNCTPVSSTQQRAQSWTAAASDYYDNVGMPCFNACITQFDKEALMGVEKRCMAGCAQISLQVFTATAMDSRK